MTHYDIIGHSFPKLKKFSAQENKFLSEVDKIMAVSECSTFSLENEKTIFPTFSRLNLVQTMAHTYCQDLCFKRPNKEICEYNKFICTADDLQELQRI
jgi:hypothetical protein